MVARVQAKVVVGVAVVKAAVVARVMEVRAVARLAVD